MAISAQHQLALFLIITFVFAAPVPGASLNNSLSINEKLLPGQELVSGPYHLLMDSDCDLSFFSVSSTNYDKVIYWRAPTYLFRFSDCTLRLESDGNLVVESQQFANRLGQATPLPMWWSHSRSGKGTYMLVVDQDEGRVKVVRVQSTIHGDFFSVVWFQVRY